MATFVLDASAMIAYLRNESGADVVEDILADRDNVCVAHAINMCEVYYDALRNGGSDAADYVVNTLLHDGVSIREDMGRLFWTDVGRLKVDPGRLSIADCAGIALARLESCDLLTADHHEMDALAGLDIISLKFIR